MSVTSSLPLPFDEPEPSIDSRIDARDKAARERAVDPRYNVALEASAGTGKTRVLVDRYINLLRAGVDPANILAITFTRKAAAEMRERILTTLNAAAKRGEIAPSRWRELYNRTSDIAISTIDAFCLSLLREFPLEADLDPGFQIAEETEIPRLVDESLDRSVRICKALAREDEDVALVFAQLGDRRTRAGLAALLSRRIVAPGVLAKYLASGPREWNVSSVASRGARGLLDVFEAMRGGLDAFLESGPLELPFVILVRRLRAMESGVAGALPLDPAGVQAAFVGAREHFLRQDGQPRSRLAYTKAMFASASDWQRHRDLVVEHAPSLAEAYKRYRRDLNVLVSRGVWRMFRIAETEYRRTLDTRAALDFSDVLLRTLLLLRQMEEFARSRYRLESRYHHVLVDEFQDTSRAQWELISLLIQSWGEGSGLTHSGPLEPSIFIVGDRKQSIYGFRDADAGVLQEAGRHLAGLRADGDVGRSISRSFRSVQPLLAFVNDACADIGKTPARRDAFRYEEEDRFPVGDGVTGDRDALGILVGDSPESCAEVAAAEIARLLSDGIEIRDRETGLRRTARPGDIAILFRTRESHREFEGALERRGILSYVYKGLGFFDADEIKDVLAMLWYLADPLSDLRAAAWLRSRFVRFSDEGLRRLAPRLSEAILSDELPETSLDESDARGLAAAREAASRWRRLVDRMPPAELLDLVLQDSAYAWEMRGSRHQQARENLKKFRGLVRRIQNRGYATLGRLVAHIDRLAVGDEANAVIDAHDAVNLMTIHAAKGLEFPIVFIVNLSRGTGNRRAPIRVGTDASGEDASVAVGDFQSEFDEDEPERDREETKRLLYVAMTRARDRLYLSSALKDGRIQPGRGSLAEVLPEALLDQFSCAWSGGEFVQWRASSGATHTLRVCPSPGVGEAQPVAGVPRGDDPEWQDDFGPVEDVGQRRRSAGDVAAGIDRQNETFKGTESNRLLGTLVHRLLQRVGVVHQMSSSHLRDVVASLLRPEEAAQVPDLEPLLVQTVGTYQTITQQPDLRELYLAPEVLHEVPFTMKVDGDIVRGTLDCLVRSSSDRVTVLEFKTGRPRPEHQAQLEIYRQAATRVFPGAAVTVRLVYAEESTGNI